MTPRKVSQTKDILPSVHSHDPINGPSSFEMAGLGVIVLEVAATEVLLVVEASARVAIWTVSTLSLAMAMAVRNNLILKHRKTINSSSFDKLANDAVAPESQGVWS